MINAIYQIGKKVAGTNLNKEIFLKNICLKIDNDKTYKQKGGSETKVKQHIVILNFNTETKKIEIDFEEINAGGKDTGKEYLWVGNPSGNNPKIYVTSDRLINSLESIIKLHPFFVTDSAFKAKFDIIINSFYKEKIFQDKNKEKKIFYINPDVFSNTLIEIKGIIEIEKQLLDSTTKPDIEKYHKNLNQEIQKLLFKFLHLNSNEVGVFTININNQSISCTRKYIDIVYNDKINSLYNNSNQSYKKFIKENNNCPVCKAKDVQTTSNFTNLGFKYYMTDKLGFSSNLDGKFINNFNICKNCYQYLMIAENFINAKLKSRIGRLNVYVIPNMIFPIKDFQVESFSKYISLKTGQIAMITDLDKIERELENYISYEDEKNSYIINYLFYQKNKSEFKVLKLIKDIPPTRIDFIRKTEEDIYNLIEEKFDDPFNKFKIDLNKIWGCIPLKMQDRKYIGTSKYLDILDNIFSGTPVNYNFLINQLMKTIKIIKYETPKYNIWEKQDFTYKIIQLNFLILFFKKLNLAGGKSMEENKQDIQINELIPKEISKYWSNIEIFDDNLKKGLFLLGYLIGEIANNQQSKDMKNKPILNKINFQGMGTEKLIRLSSDVLEKLRQNNILEYNDNTFSASHMLIEENISTWKLSNQENVFYVLSGYAFSNYLVRKRSKEKYFKELNEKMELIDKAKNENQNVEEPKKLLENAKEQADSHKYSEARKILKSIKIKMEGN